MGAPPPAADATPLRPAADAREPPRSVPVCASCAAQVLITLFVLGVALPLCIWDLARHKHERAYIGALRTRRTPFKPWEGA